MEKLTEEMKTCIIGILRHSFQGPMVGLPENQFLTWDQLGKNEQNAYGSEEGYNQLVELAKK